MMMLLKYFALTIYVSLVFGLAGISIAAASEKNGPPSWFQHADVEPEEIKWTLQAVNCRTFKGRFSDIQLRRTDTNDKLMELNRHFKPGKPDFSISIRTWLGALEIRSGNARWSSIGNSTEYRWNREISRKILEQISQTGEYSAYIKLYIYADWSIKDEEDTDFILIHHKNKIVNPEEIGRCLF